MIRKLLRDNINTLYTTHIPELVRFNYAMIAGLFLISGIMLFFLPDNMPMQFATDGSVNYYLPSYIGVWMMPAVLLLAQVLLHVQKRVNKINTAALLLVECFVVCLYLKIAFL